MTVRILNQAEVTALLPMEECIEVMDRVLRTLNSGGAQQPLRSGIRLPEGRGIFGVMPGALAAPLALGLKAIAVFPGNDGTAYDSHQGLVLLFDPEHGFPIAIMDASSDKPRMAKAATAVRNESAVGEIDSPSLPRVGSGMSVTAPIAVK